MWGKGLDFGIEEYGSPYDVVKESLMSSLVIVSDFVIIE